MVSDYNLAGAVIFVTYVSSALFFTGMIVGILNAKLWSPIMSNRQRELSHENKLQIFTALSVVSFSVLSYHMISFLVISYKAWLSVKGIEAPSRFFGYGGFIDPQKRIIRVCIWQWLTSSTLFKDFAEVICGSSARYWWTQQALLVTMTWSFFMSIEGTDRLLLSPWAFRFKH